MKIWPKQVILLCIFCASSMTSAQDRLELETTFIKGNTEMPQIIYIVPWQDMKQDKYREQTLVLHSLYGDLFEPVYFTDEKSAENSQIK